MIFLNYSLNSTQKKKIQSEVYRWRRAEFQASGTKDQMLGEKQQLRMRLRRTGRETSLYFRGFCLCF